MRVITIIGLAALVSGCSTTYYNHNIADKTALERQRAIDEGHCKRVSYGSAPMPQTRIHQPEQQNYSVTGQINTYNQGSGYSNSTYTATVRPQNSFASGFSSGLASGANLGASIAAANAENKIFHGCMLALGWSDDPTPPITNTQSRETKEEVGQTIDYLAAYQSVKSWREGVGDGFTYAIGSFTTPKSWGTNMIGIITELNFDPPRSQSNGKEADRLMVFDAFDCSARTKASLARTAFRNNEAVELMTTKAPAFSAPSDDATKNAIDRYCSSDRK